MPPPCPEQDALDTSDDIVASWLIVLLMWVPFLLSHSDLSAWLWALDDAYRKNVYGLKEPIL